MDFPAKENSQCLIGVRADSIIQISSRLASKKSRKNIQARPSLPPVQANADERRHRQRLPGYSGADTWQPHGGIFGATRDCCGCSNISLLSGGLQQPGAIAGWFALPAAIDFRTVNSGVTQ